MQSNACLNVGVFVLFVCLYCCCFCVFVCFVWLFLFFFVVCFSFLVFVLCVCVVVFGGWGRGGARGDVLSCLRFLHTNFVHA